MSAFGARQNGTTLLRRFRHYADEAEGPFAPRHRFAIVRRPDMALRDETGDEMGGDDTALGVRGEEDGIGPPEIVDPRWVG